VKGRDHSRDLGVDGWILQWIFEHSNEIWSRTKCTDSLNQLSKHELLKNDTAAYYYFLLAVFWFTVGLLSVFLCPKGPTVKIFEKQCLIQIGRWLTDLLIIVDLCGYLLQNKVKFTDNDILLYCGDGFKNYDFLNVDVFSLLWCNVV
jgi:hypothetical protein